MVHFGEHDFDHLDCFHFRLDPLHYLCEQMISFFDDNIIEKAHTFCMLKMVLLNDIDPVKIISHFVKFLLYLDVVYESIHF